MLSVTKRVKAYRQPAGGYLNKKQMEKFDCKGGMVLIEDENISPSVTGTAVDYLTRVMLSDGKDLEDIQEIFRVSVRGISRVDQFYGKHYSEPGAVALAKIKGLDGESIKSAVVLSCYDAAARAGMVYWKPAVVPDGKTTENIRTMVERSLRFLEKNGPVLLNGFTFGEDEDDPSPYGSGANGGYTNVISSGDADYLLKDTLLDMKVSKSKPTSVNTLQVLVYWRMLLRSRHWRLADGIRYIGIYNPRMDMFWRKDVSEIPEDVIEDIDYNVIGYGNEALNQEYRDRMDGIFAEKIEKALEHPEPE